MHFSLPKRKGKKASFGEKYTTTQQNISVCPFQIKENLGIPERQDRVLSESGSFPRSPQDRQHKSMLFPIAQKVPFLPPTFQIEKRGRGGKKFGMGPKARQDATGEWCCSLSSLALSPIIAIWEEIAEKRSSTVPPITERMHRQHNSCRTRREKRKFSLQLSACCIH